MSRYIFVVMTLFFAVSCETDDVNTNRNPNLLNINVNLNVNTNLPQYSLLQFPSNAVYIPNVGNKGIFVINTGTGIRAWEASDPNHTPNDCSQMKLNGIEATCDCEDNTYILVNGLPKNNGDLPYPLLEYRATQSGNLIVISN
ncbi:MAG: hypothetical protein WBG71_02935 [Leeuwenhoekiella sp.]